MGRPAPFHRESELLIMIAVVRPKRCMGRTERPDLNFDCERALVGTAILIESEMALFYECMLKCAEKLLDTADIVREAIFRQLRILRVWNRKTETGQGWSLPNADLPWQRVLPARSPSEGNSKGQSQPED